MIGRLFALLAAAVFLSTTCDSPEDSEILTTINSSVIKVVIVVIDGPRLLDTWAHPQRQYIPYQHQLSQEGVFFSNFFNDGDTHTISGHAALTTGTYEYVKNNGDQQPALTSIFQRYLAARRNAPTDAFVITSKEKLHVLANCQQLNWRDSFLPAVDAQDREDSVTLRVALDILSNDQPTLSLVHFREPDHQAHQSNWEGYLQGIRTTDDYVQRLWNFIQTHTAYRHQTMMFVTNDHGRHLNGIGEGFVEHGDHCEGCRRISLLALGPGLPAGQVVEKYYGLIDLAPTIARLLNFRWRGEGQPIIELLNP